MRERPIQYEPHPVSPARKAEIIGQGFRIIDAKFRPADQVEAVAPTCDSEPPAPDVETEAAAGEPPAPVKQRAKPGPKPKAAVHAD